MKLTTMRLLFVSGLFYALGGTGSAAVAQRADGTSRTWTQYATGMMGGFNGIAVGPNGTALWAADPFDDALVEIGITGSPVVAYPLRIMVGSTSQPFSPHKLVFGGDHNIYMNGCLNDHIHCNFIVVANTHGNVVGTYSTRNDSPDGGLALGPDGNVWFNETHDVGKITPGGDVTAYVYKASYGKSNLDAIAAGPDGKIWFSYNPPFNMSGYFAALGKLDPSTGKIVMYKTGFLCNSTTAIVPWQNLIYFPFLSESMYGELPYLEEMTLNGKRGHYRETPVQASANTVLGPDGNLWFPSCPKNASGSGGCYFGTNPPGFARFNPPTHTFENFEAPGGFGVPFGDAVVGPGGYLWTTMGATLSGSSPAAFVRYGPIT